MDQCLNFIQREYVSKEMHQKKKKKKTYIKKEVYRSLKFYVKYLGIYLFYIILNDDDDDDDNDDSFLYNVALRIN